MIWKSIQGYEGYYEVSDTGMVRSLNRNIPDKVYGVKHLTGKEMKLSEAAGRNGGDGYLVVNLRKMNTSTVVPVHRLVAETFIDNPRNLPTINHIDGNKHNNNVANLEWASYAENNIHALENKLRIPRGVKIMQFTPDGKFIAEYRSVCEASRETGIGRGVISHCVNNIVKTAGGFIWCKVDKCNDYPDNGSTAEDELPSEVLGSSNNSEDIV